MLLKETTFSPSISLENDIKPFLVPEPILILYALVTCLLVGVHMLALMISTCILPQIEATAIESFDLEQQTFMENKLLNHSTLVLSMAAPNNTAATTRPSPNSQTPPQPPPVIHLNDAAAAESDSVNKAATNNPSPHTPHHSHRFLFSSNNNEPTPSIGAGITITDILFPYNQYHHFIELAWISSTVIGIFLFIVEIGLVCYIKFYPISTIAALIGAIVMAPILALFVIFTFTFYRRLAAFKLGLTKLFLHQVDRNLRPFNDNII